MKQFDLFFYHAYDMEYFNILIFFNFFKKENLNCWSMSQLNIFYDKIVEFSGIQYCNIDIID